MKENLRILLFDPLSAERKEMAAALQAMLPQIRILEEDAGIRTEPLAESGNFDICLLGPSLSVVQQLDFLARLRSRTKAALIVVLAQLSKDNLSALLAAGAHGVLAKPYNKDLLKKVLSSALERFEQSHVAQEGEAEQITSLPWLLERVAKRLHIVASRLETETHLDALSAEAQKVILTRILLEAIASTSTSDEDLGDELLHWLIGRWR